jgi:hypothetical protein
MQLPQPCYANVADWHRPLQITQHFEFSHVRHRNPYACQADYIFLKCLFVRLSADLREGKPTDLALCGRYVQKSEARGAVVAASVANQLIII